MAAVTIPAAPVTTL